MTAQGGTYPLREGEEDSIHLLTTVMCGNTKTERKTTER
jgi:hypothetical protein